MDDTFYLHQHCRDESTLTTTCVHHAGYPRVHHCPTHSLTFTNSHWEASGSKYHIYHQKTQRIAPYELTCEISPRGSQHFVVESYDASRAALLVFRYLWPDVANGI